MKTYTYAQRFGNYIVCRGFNEDGTRFNDREEFYPTLFKSINKHTGYKDLFGQDMLPVQPGTMWDCKKWLEENSEIANVKVLGMTNYVTQYIGENYPGEIKLDTSKFKIQLLDIETECENGFPRYENPIEKINVLTLYDNQTGKFYTYTMKDVELDAQLLADEGIDINDVELCTHVSEEEMLRSFVSDWHSDCPDILSGWNSEFFDVPYLYARICRVLGEKWGKLLSPWKSVNDRQVQQAWGVNTTFDLVGVNHLDYLALMKKYTYGGRESWKLDNVAEEELGKKKLAYDGSFREFYTKDWNRFVAYNIIDVNLVKLLDDKMKLFDLALTIAYDCKINPCEVFSQIRAWDSLIYNELKAKSIIIPNNEKAQREAYAGAFVKDPIAGKHKWVVSFDLQSLYPHLMMWANISPETMTPYRKDVTVEGLLNQKFDNSDLHEQDIAMTANGVTFRKDKQGFIPEMVQRIYDDRSKFKKQMLKTEQQYADTKDESLIPEISRLNNLQMARKIQINSVYGAMGSPFFRYYDIRMAEGITTSGQLGIRWVSNALNVLMNKVCKTKDVDYCVYNDTDSCYFTLEKFVEMYDKSETEEDTVKFVDKFCDEVMQKAINNSYEKLKDYMNSYQQKLIMKREAIANVGVFVAKKRYALTVWNNEGVQYPKPKLKVTGLELVKSSTPHVVRDVLKDGVIEVLTGSEESVQKFIADYRKKYDQEPIEMISYPRSVNGLGKYAGSPVYKKGTPIHVRAALLYNHWLKEKDIDGIYESILDGGKMKFVYLRMPNPIHENIIGFIDQLPKEFGLHNYIDYDKMFNKSFVEGMKTIMEPLKWTAQKINTLEDLFG